MPVIVIEGRRWLVAREAAELLEVTPDHVRRLIRVGSVAGTRVTGQWLVDEASVLDYRRRRAPWAPTGVYGGRAAAERLGVLRPALRPRKGG